MTNEYQEIKSIVDAGYRLVVYPYCFLMFLELEKFIY